MVGGRQGYGLRLTGVTLTLPSGALLMASTEPERFISLSPACAM